MAASRGPGAQGGPSKPPTVETGETARHHTRLSGPPPPVDQTRIQQRPGLSPSTVAGGLVGKEVAALRGAPLARTKAPQSAAPLDETVVGASPPRGAQSGHHSSAPPRSRDRTQLADGAEPTQKAGTSIHPSWMSPGARIRQYELIRELGRGGMGTVWLARDTRLGRRVAIKFLSLTDRIFHDRFLVEARATAQCQHDNIVVIHEVDEHEGTPLMVLEFLEGQALADIVEGRIVPAPRAVDFMIPVARALVRAHAEGLAHRDLKPDNIFVTELGTVKVLDFGIAKLFHEQEGLGGPSQKVTLGSLKEVYRTVSTGSLVGTLPYMSPEQWGLGAVDHRTDLWAVGIILYEMVTGRHPVEPLTAENLTTNISDLDVPFPSVGTLKPDLPDRLVAVIDRCLQKRSEARFQSAQELLNDLLPLSPRDRLSLADGENPYPGLSAFQESDASRFFGRERDIARATAALEGKPLLAVVGASGVGKSSFVRAGILPALKSKGEDWESLVLRPGRSPVDSLATLLAPLVATEGGLPTTQGQITGQHREIAERLRAEPGYLGTALRARAHQRGAKYLLFVDQMEELYTLVESEQERRVFTQCLSGAADDASAPLRVVISMRSDLLDRMAEDTRFQMDVTRGIVLLAPPDREGLRRAVSEPPAMLGYSFEDDQMVEQMLDALENTAGSLPLLQFAASRLWDQRDEGRKLMTRASFEAMGGIGGALASHADEVLKGMSPDLRALTRVIFQRLVTPERTRAILDIEEINQLHPDGAEVQRLIQHLASARLVVVQTTDEADEGNATVEVVHESLIAGWPTLRRWLDESQEDAAFIAQLRSASKQWDARARDRDLLWRGEALDEAVRFQKRFRGALAERERAYLDASVQLATRSARIRRGALVATIAFLSLLVAAGSVALVAIREAEQEARSNADKATQEAERAGTAEKLVTRQLEIIKQEEQARLKAESEALEAIRAADLSREELEQAYSKVRAQLVLVQQKEQQRKRAEASAAAAHAGLSDAQAKADAATEEAQKAKSAAKMDREQLERAYAEANLALAEAKKASQRAEQERQRAQSATRTAEAATQSARAAKAEVDALLAKERARNAALQQQQGKIATELK